MAAENQPQKPNQQDTQPETAQAEATQPVESAPESQAPPDVQWKCALSAIDDRGQPAGDLPDNMTVGQPFHMACEGPPAQLKKEALRFELPGKHAPMYALRLLRPLEVTESRAELVVTSWTPAEVKLQNPLLTDGATKVGLGDLSFNVTSVITPENNPEGKPFPAWGPLILPWPMWVWVALAVLIAAVGAAIFAVVNRRLKRRRLLTLLQKNAVPLSPLHQFSKDLRRLGREYPVGQPGFTEQLAKDYLSELNKCFRWYLAREFVIPAHDARPGQVLRDLRRVNKDLEKEDHRELLLALKELEKGIRTNEKISSEDVMRLSDICRALADRLTQAQKKRTA